MTSRKPDHSRDVLIEQLVDTLKKKATSKQEAALLSAFIPQYFGTAPLDDLHERTVQDLAGAALCHWHFIAQRKPGESKLRVYNPNYEEHGWQSTHTIIEVSHDDMPFLVDSLRM